MASKRIRADIRNPKPPSGGAKKPPTKKGALGQVKGINVGFGKMPMPPAGSGSMTTLPAKASVRKPASKKPPIGGRKGVPISRGGQSAKAGYADAAEVGWMPSASRKSTAKKPRKAGGVYGRGML